MKQTIAPFARRAGGCWRTERYPGSCGRIGRAAWTRWKSAGGCRRLFLDGQFVMPAPLVHGAIVHSRVEAEVPGGEVNGGGLLTDVAIGDDTVTGFRASG